MTVGDSSSRALPTWQARKFTSAALQPDWQWLVDTSDGVLGEKITDRIIETVWAPTQNAWVVCTIKIYREMEGEWMSSANSEAWGEYLGPLYDADLDLNQEAWLRCEAMNAA